MVNAAGHSFSQARELNPQCREASQALVQVSRTGPLARGLGWLRERFKR
jgi:hypothetical protein